MQKSREAREIAIMKQIQEEIRLAWNAVQIDGKTKGWDNTKKSDELRNELRKEDDKAETTLNEPNIKVEYKGYETTINTMTGSMTPLVKIGTNAGNDLDGINWEELKRTATKHPDQKSTDDIGIDANGNICNLDLWDYEVFDDILYLGYMDGCYGMSTSCYVPYSQSSVIDTSNVEMINLVCPQCIKINGEWKDVTSLGSDCFYDYTDVESIKLPSCLTVIKGSSFWNCSSLETLTIPPRVTDMESSFTYCESLTNLVLPAGVTSIIMNDPFEGCNSLAHVTANLGILQSESWPSSLETFEAIGGTEIGSSEFENCSKLTSITIPNTVTSIGSYAFYGSGLTSITIPDTVTLIENGAFESTNISSVAIPNAVESIGDGAFSTDSLKSVTGPVGIYLSSWPSSIETFTINRGTEIGSGEFENCSQLTSITIPNTVTSIGESAFRNTGLTTVEIPNTVTSIGAYAFDNCYELTDIVIPNTVTSIGSYAFYDSGLTSITIPNTVTSIGEMAFSEALTNVTAPVGINTSSWPSSIETFTINGGTSIGQSEFEGCFNLTSITIPEYVTSIGYYSFARCYSLRSAKIDSATIVNDIYNDSTSITYLKEWLSSLYIKASLYNSEKDTIPSGWSSSYVLKFNSIENGYAVYLETSASNGSEGSGSGS